MPPFLAALFAQGFSLLGNAVLAKGKDVIEKELGVDLEESVQTEEGLLELKKLEFSHQEFLVNAAQREAEMSFADTKDARAMNAAIQEAVNASSLAKNAAYYIDFGIIAATFVLTWVVLFKEIPPDNANLIYLALGSFLTMCGTILNFHRGSSKSSQNAQDTIRQISTRKQP